MTTRALVVGGTSGIGYAMACRVAANSSTSSVIISGRTKPTNIPHSNIEFRPIDATSMHQIKQFTDTIKSEIGTEQKKKKKLDYLIMTQGVMTLAGRTETPEGIDRKMALHYYGKQLLIRELLPALEDDAKIITVYDGWSGNPKKLIWEDLDLKTQFSLGNAANNCTVMTDVMVQYYAAEQLREGMKSKRHFIHAYPGGVNTGLMRDLPKLVSPVVNVLANAFLTSPDDCAKYLLDGTSECTAKGEEVGRFWSNIDNKGRLLTKKMVFDEEQMGKVAKHTWGLINNALEVEVNS